MRQSCFDSDTRIRDQGWTNPVGGTRALAILANFSLIACTAFLSVCPPLLLSILPYGLLINAVSSILEVLCTWYAVQSRIKELERIERHLTAHPGDEIPEAPLEQLYWSANALRRLQLLFATCSIVLIVAAFGMSFFQLPVLLSASLVCMFSIIFTMKGTAHSAIKKGIDRRLFLDSVEKRLPLLLCFFLPVLISPFCSVPVLIGAALAVALLTTIWVSQKKEIRTEENKYVEAPIMFCALGLFASLAAAPFVTLLASVLAINITTCFTTQSLMEGLHDGIKSRVFSRYRGRFWESIRRGAEPDPDSPRAASVHSGDERAPLLIPSS